MFEHRDKTIQIITDLRIPITMVGRAAGLPSQRISDFTRRAALPAAMEMRISETVEAIELIWSAFSPFRVELDSPELLKSGLAIAAEVEQNRAAQALHKEFETAKAEIESALSAM